MEEANERLKHRKRVEECQRKGWKAHWEPREVGCRGFAARSLCKIYIPLGHTRAVKRNGRPMLLGHKPGSDQPCLGRLGNCV